MGNNLILAIFLAYSFAAQSIDNVSILAKKLTYNKQAHSVIAQEQVTVVGKNYILSTEKLIYDQARDEIYAPYTVLVRDKHGNSMMGSSAVFQDNLQNLQIENVNMKFADTAGLFAATQASRNSQDIIDVEYGCYSACRTDQFKNPIWQIKAEHIHIDRKKEMARYKNVRFEIFGMPVIFLPRFSYPTPGAKAKNGFLAPSSFGVKDFRVPIYFRPKSNMDFTITPRFVSSDMILETEGRYLNNYGRYDFNSSIFQAPSIKRDPQGNILSDSIKRQYHFFSKGKFNFEGIDSGFSIKRASDPAYLRKYYSIYDPYLESNVYASFIDHANYSKVSVLYFQDMRADKLLAQNQIAMPKIEVRRVVPLGNADLSVDSNVLFYQSGNKYQAFRSSNIFELYRYNEIGNNILEFTLYNKLDVYQYHYNVNNQNYHEQKRSSFVRNLPEAHTLWRYPILMRDIIIEPTVLIANTLVRPKAYGIMPIDSENYFELNDLNVMEHNRFSGSDNNETGNRVNYGINLLKNTDNADYSMFMGKSYSKNAKDDLVGKFTFKNDLLEFYYRYNLTKKVKFRMQEAGLHYSFDKKLDFFVGFFQLRKMKSQMLTNPMAQRNVSNVTSNIKYKFDDHWAISLGATFDMAKDPSLLIKSVGVTYDYDCVRISAVVSDNFTHDITRNIKKSRNKTVFLIGLKTINM
jgi:LPS-assembly protein